MIGGRLRPNPSLAGSQGDLSGEGGPNLARDEVCHRVPLEGSREEVALAEPAPKLTQPPELGRRFDAFGDGRQPEGASDLDDRMDDPGAPPGLVERSHERSVDLDVGDREALEVGQRRVSGPEVVDRNLNAQGTDGV